MTSSLSRLTFRMRNGIKAFTALILATVLSVSGLEYQANALTLTSGNCSANVNVTTNVSVFSEGNYCYVAFKGTGTNYSWTPPNGVNSIDLLVVAGGGGGGSRHGSGGGAGGLLQSQNLSISKTAATITVGAGGSGGAGANSSSNGSGGASGSNTTVSGMGISSLTAQGGGAGGYNTGGASGGSGGGSWSGTAVAQGTSGQGNSGALGTYSTSGPAFWVGGAGGGAGSAATAASTVTAKGGLGGSGLAISWIPSTLGLGEVSNSQTYFAGGGGGGSTSNSTGGSGGIGGGSAGSTEYAVVASTIANTGGGGGGSGYSTSSGSQAGGAGAAGIVVIRYLSLAGTLTDGECSATLDNTTSASIASVTDYCVITLSGATTYSWARPSAVTSVDVLVVGGGGGGGGGGFLPASNGSYGGGGSGGGGGQATSSTVAVSSSSYEISVGSGGAAGQPASGGAWGGAHGGTGTASSGFGITAVGGGQGYGASANNVGFSSWSDGLAAWVGGTSGSGILGGVRGTTGAGGGGGQSGVGTAGSGINGSSGGAGLSSSLTGTAAIYGAGGSGGAGGNVGAVAAAAATGFGAGGSGGRGGHDGTRLQAAGTAGANGAVIIRYAKFHTVTYNYDGATSGNSTASAVYTRLSSGLTLPTPIKTGLTFMGWYSDAQKTTRVGGGGSAYTTTSNTTLYASWAVVNYTVTWDSNGGSTVTGTSSFTDPGSISEPSPPTKTGKYFAGWSTAETANQGNLANKISSWPYTPSAANLTLYAIWLDDNSISFTGTGHSSAQVGINSTSVNLAPRDDSFTWEAWIYPTGFAGTGATKWANVLDNGSSGNNYGRTWLQVSDSGSGPFLNGGYYPGGVNGSDYNGVGTSSTANTIALNRWQHVAMTVTRSAPSDGTCTTSSALTVKLYVDGVLKQQANDPTLVGCTSSNGLMIGDNFDDFPQQFKGKIDQVKVWSGALTDAEVAASRTTYSNAGIDNALRAHYDFNDLAASPAMNDVIDNRASSATTYNLTVTGLSSSATSYAGATDTATVTSNVARSQNQFQVTYDANTATSGTTTSESSLTPYTSLNTPGAGDLVRTGYSFGGWNTLSTGSGINFLESSTYQLLYGDQTLYSNWTANTYTVTYDYNGATGGNSATTGSFTSGGTAITLPVPTKTGYAFGGWFESSTFAGSALSTTYSPTSTLNIYAKWTANTYTVTYDYNSATGGNSTVSSSFTVGGSAITLPVPTKTGYTFAGWFENSSFTGSALSTTYSPSASITIYAKWTANPYTVTYDYNSATGGNSTAFSSFTVGGSAITLPVPTRTGYTFAGWFESSTFAGSALATTYSPTSTRTIYAKWTINTFTVTYNKNGASGNAERASESYTFGATAITLPTIGSMTKTGYTFDGWSETNGGSKISGTYTPTASITLYARWVAACFSVTYNNNSATSGSPSATSDSYTTGGTAITLSTQSTLLRTGYTFAGWSTTINDSSTRINNSGSYTITAPVILYALWTPVDYSVTYSTQGSTGGTAPSEATVFHIGDTAVVKANTGALVKTGYTFSGWTVASDGSGTVLTSGDTVAIASSNVTLYPKWTANTYTVTFNVNGAAGAPAGYSSGSSPFTDSYTSGTSGLTLPAVGTMVKTGYDFAGWSTTPSGGAITNTGFTTATDKTLYAVWNLKSINYTYTRGVANGNAVTGSNITNFPNPFSLTGLYGSVINLSTAISPTAVFGSESYQFMGWNDGYSTYASNDAFTVGETASTFTATWVRLYEVRYALNGGGGIIDTDPDCAQGNNTCLANQVIHLSDAPTRAGYSFTGWKDQSNNSFAAGASTTVTDTSFLYFAQWQAINYTMAFNAQGGSTSPAQLTKNISDTFTLPSPGTKTGYTFSGWFDGTNTYGVGANYTVGTASKTFAAIWTANVYTVTYNWNGGTGTSVPDVNYTYGTAAITLPTGSTHTRDGYTFAGWATSQGGPAISGGFTPTGDTLLYARWVDGSYTVTLNAHGGTLNQSTFTVSRGNSMTLPTPTRTGFVFDGWYEDSATTLVAGQANTSFAPVATATLHAKWVQNSLAGVNPAHINSLTSITVTGAHTWSGTHSASGTGASLSIPNGALPNGTVVKVSFIEDLSRPRNIIDSSYAYYTSVIVHWLTGTGDSATVPATAANKPLTLTMTNPAILPGARVFMIINGVATEAAEATQAGQVTIEITQDPEFVIAATKPNLPSSVTATAVTGSQATVSWAAPSSTGGAPITGYTVTANPGGATCSTTAALTCDVPGLSSGVSYSYSVVADNAIGTSGVRSTTVTYVPPVVPSTPINISPTTPREVAAPAADVSSGVSLARSSEVVPGAEVLTEAEVPAEVSTETTGESTSNPVAERIRKGDTGVAAYVIGLGVAGGLLVLVLLGLLIMLMRRRSNS